MDTSSSPSPSEKEAHHPRPTEDKIRQYGWEGCQRIIKEGIVSRGHFSNPYVTLFCDNAECTVDNGKIRYGEKYAVSTWHKTQNYKELNTHANPECEKLIVSSRESLMIDSLKYLTSLDPHQVWKFEQEALFDRDPHVGQIKCASTDCRSEILDSEGRVYFWNGSEDHWGEGEPGENFIHTHVHCQHGAFPGWTSPHLATLFHPPHFRSEVSLALSRLQSTDSRLIATEESIEPYIGYHMEQRLLYHPKRSCAVPSCSKTFEGGERVTTLWDKLRGRRKDDVDSKDCVTVHPTCLSDALPESTVNAPLVPVDPTKTATDRRRYSTGQFTDPFFG